MDQPRAIVEQTRLEKLLEHYDINDFVKFLAKKKFLSAFEPRFLSGTKQEIISHLARRDRFESGLLGIFYQYTTFVLEDVSLVLSEISRTRDHIFPPKQESDSDSFSSSSFSEDSDPGQYSQENPNDISECSSIVEDPGYCTQSNSLGFSLTNNVQLPSPEYLEATSTQLQPTTMHRSRPKQNRGSSTVHITNNYFNSVPMHSTSGCSSLPFTQHQSPNQGYSAETDSRFSLQSRPVYEKIEKFKLVLQKHNRELIECLNVRSLLPYLYEQELLTSDEYETLKMGTRNEQNQSLLHILPSKGEHACKRFLKCLTQAKEHLGHEQLATLFEHF